jgi:hypothetical protein
MRFAFAVPEECQYSGVRDFPRSTELKFFLFPSSKAA